LSGHVISGRGSVIENQGLLEHLPEDGVAKVLFGGV
jgi:hypothetical protein